MIPVLISQSHGLAIFDTGSELGIIRTQNPDEIEYKTEQLISKLTSQIKDFEAINVKDLEALKKILEIRQSREEQLNLALILIDPTYSLNTKKAAAKALSSPRKYDEWRWVENVLFSNPEIDELDLNFALKVNTPYKDTFDTLLNNKHRISLLRRSIYALPSHTFHNQSRNDLVAFGINKSVFSTYVRGIAPTKNNPFTKTIKKYAKQLDKITQEKADNGKKIKLKHSDLTWDITPWQYAVTAYEWDRIKFKNASIIASLFSTKECTCAEEYNKELDKRFKKWNIHIATPDISESLKIIKSLSHEINIRFKSTQKDSTIILYKLKKSISIGLNKTTTALITQLSNLLNTDPTYEIKKSEKNRKELNSDCPLRKKHLTPSSPQDIGEIFGTYALEELFHKDGGILNIHTENIIISNLKSRKAINLAGQEAKIIIALHNRLLADFNSGLPSAHCGWTSIKKLIIESPNITQGGIYAVKIKTISSGFSKEMIQVTEEEIRLNPELTTSPSRD